MKEIGQGLKTIAKEQRGLLALMIVTALLSVILMIFTLVQLNPNAAVTKVGYGDIGGYRDGMWSYPLSFVIFALVCGVLHNLLAVRIFQKNGLHTAVMFMSVTIMVLVMTFIVLGRLLGEG